MTAATHRQPLGADPTADLVSPDPDLTPRQFLRATTGATYRQIDYWRTLGLISDRRHPGSGHGTRWRAIDVAAVAALVALSRVVNPGNRAVWVATADAAYEAAAHFSPLTTIDLGDDVRLALPVRLDWWRYARRP